MTALWMGNFGEGNGDGDPHGDGIGFNSLGYGDGDEYGYGDGDGNQKYSSCGNGQGNEHGGGDGNGNRGYRGYPEVDLPIAPTMCRVMIHEGDLPVADLTALALASSPSSGSPRPGDLAGERATYVRRRSK